MRKVLATMMAMSMVMGMGVMAHAADYSTQVGVTGEAAQISVTVPTSIDAIAGQTKAHSMTFENTGGLAVVLEDVAVTDSTEWGLHDRNGDGWTDDGYNTLTQVVDSFKYDVKFNGSSMATNKGSINLGYNINAKDTLELPCEVTAASVTAGITEIADLCSIDYTFDFFTE